MSVQVDINALFVELVAKNMVACGETRQLPGSVNMWRIACMLFKGGNKEAAKQGLSDILRQAWGAEDIKFTVPKSGKPGQFDCTFRSDLY